MAEGTRRAPREWWDTAYNRVGVWVKQGVRRWRWFDAWALQPLPPDRRWFWELLAPSGYPFFIPVLMLVLCFGVSVGPRPANATPATLALFAFACVLVLVVHAAARLSDKVRLTLAGYYLAILLAVGLLLVVVVAYATTDYDPFKRSLRVHVGPVVAVLLTLLLAVSSRAAGAVARRVPGERMPLALPHVELFEPRSRSDYMGATPPVALLYDFFLVPLLYPVQLLLPASIAALVVTPEWVRGLSLAMLAVAWAFLYVGILFDRFMEILKTVGRLAFVGPQRVLSIVVIVIAAARWLRFRYVDYLFDNPDGTWTIVSYIAFSYAVAWFYGFWTDILLARRFIRVLNGDDRVVTSVPYRFEGDENVTQVWNRHRTICLHGGGRLKVEGFYDRAYRRSQRIGKRKAVAFLTPLELLGKFRTQVEDHAWVRGDGPDPLPRIRDLQRAVFSHVAVAGALPLLLLGGTFCLAYSRTAQNPELDIVFNELAVDPKGPVGMPMRPLLLGTVPAEPREGGCGPLTVDKPRIAVAASGGGTRAAIYTAAVLRGLAEQGKICNVVLVSGVSGGSAALAYFAIHQDELRSPDYDRKAWDAFQAAMAKSYIQTVIDAASDSAVAFGTWRPRRQVCGEPVEPPEERAQDLRPLRVRLGNLLAESFVCAMKPPDATGEWGRMGQVRFGLILNTGLAGAYEPKARSHWLDVPAQARLARGDPARRSDNAGGRLLLANIPQPQPAQDMPALNRSPDLRFLTINDPEMSVARAAALSANFPPVFADAAIDERHEEEDRRFWVTDGGTVENRGTVTLYLAVEDALPEQSDVPPAAKWPDLHVLVADVSAVGGPYKEGFGLGTVEGAGAQMGLALEAELIRDLQAAYKDHGKFVVHELPMPATLRDAIGTHWMMPNGITAEGWQNRKQRLSKDETLDLVASLFTAPGQDDSAAERTVRTWASFEEPKGDDPPSQRLPYAAEWAALTAALDAPPATQAATQAAAN